MSVGSPIPGDNAREALIIIEGSPLSFAQSMAVRVAIETFAMSLHSDGMGEDRLGRNLTKNYLRLIDEIREHLYRGSQ